MEIGQAAQHITELIQSIDKLASTASAAGPDGQFNLVFDSAETSGQRLIDRAFSRALILVVIILVGLPVMLLGYRWMSRRMK
jgi:hypothetical protein